MKDDVVHRLLALNAEFYRVAAPDFDATRERVWPGLDRVRPYLAEVAVPTPQVLDAGCGNGRLLPFAVSALAPRGYVGVDASAALLRHARRRWTAPAYAAMDIQFLQADLTDPDWTAQLAVRSRFDVAFCLAVLHHIPTRTLRGRVLGSLARNLTREGLLILSNWQPHHSPRQRQKMADWSVLCLTATDVEDGDCLMTWKRGVDALRFVHILDREEMVQLARAAGLRVLGQFEADGREENLNLYSILQKI